MAADTVRAAGPGRMVGVQDDLSFNGSVDPDEWYRWAREWREAGRFEEALRAHEWYHAHVLKLNEAAYGVRLSYALHDWKGLARQYPPAKVSLMQVRSQAAAASIREVPDDLAFHEALSVDWVLGNEAAAYDLIGQVETTHPNALHEYYNNHVFHVLSDRREYLRCLRWMGDAAHELDLAAELLDFQRSSTGPERIRERAPDRFVDRVIDLVLVVLGAGDTTGAEEIVRRAERHLDHPRLTDALDEARRILEEKPPVPG
jgi:hypothetical protein